MKSKKIEILIKVLVPLIIIGSCFGIQKLISIQKGKSYNKPIVINEDSQFYESKGNEIEILSNEVYGSIDGFSKNYGFISDNEVLVGIGMSQEEFTKKYPDDIEKGTEEYDALYDNMINDMYGKVYILNLSTLERKPLNMDARDVYSDIISGVNKLSYLSEDKLYIYDVNENSKILYKNIDDLGALYFENNNPKKIETECWTKNGEYLIGYEETNNSQYGDLTLYNVKENSLKSFQVDNENSIIGMVPSYYSDDGSEIYYISKKYKTEGIVKKYLVSDGISKVNSDTGEIEEVFQLPYRDTELDNYSRYSGIGDKNYYVLDKGKKIIFGGTIEGVDGTYIYDTENKEFHNIIPHTVASEKGGYGSFIWVSPDENKIIYMNLVEENGEKQWNLYAANISGNNLINRKCIYKNIDFIEDIKWSADSKKILFFTSDKIEKGIKDNTKINIITFK